MNTNIHCALYETRRQITAIFGRWGGGGGVTVQSQPVSSILGAIRVKGLTQRRNRGISLLTMGFKLVTL